MAYTYTNGDGSIDNPFQIFTLEDLQGIQDYPNKNFILMNDLYFDRDEAELIERKYCHDNEFYSIYIDEKYIYVAVDNDYNKDYIYIFDKFTKQELTYISELALFVQCPMVSDENYFYYTETNGKVHIIDKNDFSEFKVIDGAIDYDWDSNTYIAIDENYLYVTEWFRSSSGRDHDNDIIIYDKNNDFSIHHIITLLEALDSDYSINGIFVDENNIYISFYGNMMIYNKNDYSYIDTIIQGETELNHFHIDDDYIYFYYESNSTSDLLRVYNKNDFSLFQEYDIGEDIYSMYSDENFIYLGTEDTDIIVLNKSDFTERSRILPNKNYNDQIASIVCDDDCIYFIALDDGLDGDMCIYKKPNVTPFQWSPIKSNETMDAFSGSLDGQDYTLYNYVNHNGQGLFADCYDDIIIKNLNLNNFNIKGTSDINNLASLINKSIGVLNNPGEISNCSINDINIGDDQNLNGDYSGILIGEMQDVNIKNITINNSTISCNNYIGGIIGSLNNGILENININDCEINGVDYVGGVTANLNNGILENINTNSCEINGIDYVGGVIGKLNSGSIENINIRTINVSGVDYAGGVISQLDDGITNVNNINIYDLIMFGNQYCGGIISNIIGESHVKDIKIIKMNLEAMNYSGGIISIQPSNTTFENCQISDGADYYSNINQIIGTNSDSGYFGLFAYKMEVDSIATGIEVVGEIDCTGGQGHIGGLVYENNGSIENSLSDVIINENSANTGGFVGVNNGDINQCGTINSITSDGVAAIGGFAAINNSSIIESYSVTLSHEFTNQTTEPVINAFIGTNDGTTDNCYYNSTTWGNEDDTTATPLSDTQNKDNFTNWDFNDDWIDPNLNYSLGPIPKKYKYIYSSGNGTEDDPFLISTIEDIYGIGDYICAHYKLINDIDFIILDDWDPIPHFGGVLDGNGYNFNNFICIKDKAGLFSHPLSNYTIKNLTFFNPILGHENAHQVGIISYYIYDNDEMFVKGTIDPDRKGEKIIENCHIIGGDISGSGHCGGFVGYYSSNDESKGFSFKNCSIKNTVFSITDSGYCGGFMGSIQPHVIFNGCEVMNVRFRDGGGGLVGFTWGGYDELMVVQDYNFDIHIDNGNGGAIGGLCGQGIRADNCNGELTISGLGGGGGLSEDIGDDSYISNCNVKFTVMDGTSYTGGLIGYSGYNSTFENINVESYIYNESNKDDYYVGGLLGYSYGVTCHNCNITGEIGIFNNTGGFGGYFTNSSAYNCHSDIKIIPLNDLSNFDSVKNFNYIGGFIGNGSIADDGTIEKCSAKINFDISDEILLSDKITINDVGGFAGIITSNNSDTISQCYATGIISGQNEVGGFIGNSQANVKNSYFIGDVKGIDTVAGFVGSFYVRESSPKEIKNCYTSSTIEIINDNDQKIKSSFYGDKSGDIDPSIINSYYNSDLTSLTDTSTAKGKTTKELEKQKTYENWDFDNIWKLDNNIQNLPILVVLQKEESQSKVEKRDYEVILNGSVSHYRAPNSYSRFTNNVTYVNNPGATRIMGLVGTGLNNYEIFNEMITRSSNKCYDTLQNENISSIYSLSNKIIKQNIKQNNLVVYSDYENIPYEIKDRKYIVWNHDDPTFDVNNFNNVDITININDNKEYLIEDGEYKIEISHINDNENSLYDASILIINNYNNEVLNNCLININENYNDIIEGLNIKINSLNNINIGDYLILNTNAGIINDDTLPKNNSSYYVSYRYSKTNKDYEPKIFFDYDDIVEEYGNYDITITGQVINSLALGAEIAFQNGLRPIVCVQARSNTPYEIKKAIDKLQRNIPGIDNVNTVIPLTTNEDVQSHVVNHVTKMSNEKNSKERMVYLGSPQINDVSEYVVKAKEIADSFDNERVVYVVPDGAMKDVRDLRTSKINERFIPSPYVAVSVAALGLRNDPAEPLTGKYITGFNKLNKTFTKKEKDYLANAGALVLEQVGNMIRVRHGITTSTNDVNSNEITLIQIKDYIIESCRMILSQSYIGKKIHGNIIGNINYTITSILNQFIAEEVILSYQNLKISRNKNNPTQIDVRFEIEAIYPLNYIDITFGFVLS